MLIKASGQAMNVQTPVAVVTGQHNAVHRGGPFTALLAAFCRPVLDRIDAGLAAGAIEATLPDGQIRMLGARADGTKAVLHIGSWWALVRLATGGSGGWYVAWRKGEWTSPDPVALFEVMSANRRTLGRAARAQGLSRRLLRWANRARRNSRAGSKRNVAAHYDLGNDFYAAWLDPSLSYSSALFVDQAESLEDAQRRKLQAILDRTATGPGDRLLEIGCGWGSFAALASDAGRQVHAITLSAAQKAAIDGQARPAVTVSLMDYRDVADVYDGIASIEMVEAVGQDFWPDYLAVIARALRPGGRAAIQYIAIDDAIFDAYAGNVDFIQRYVFPGGMLVSRRRFRAIAEEAGLEWRDDHCFGADYAETLRRWRVGFDDAVDAGRLPPRFDQHFIALWRFYLMYCEGGFRGGGLDVAQVTLVKR